MKNSLFIIILLVTLLFSCNKKKENNILSPNKAFYPNGIIKELLNKDSEINQFLLRSHQLKYENIAVWANGHVNDTTIKKDTVIFSVSGTKTKKKDIIIELFKIKEDSITFKLHLEGKNRFVQGYIIYDKKWKIFKTHDYNLDNVNDDALKVLQQLKKDRK